jgi:hypothetical protein
VVISHCSPILFAFGFKESSKLIEKLWLLVSSWLLLFVAAAAAGDVTSISIPGGAGSAIMGGIKTISLFCNVCVRLSGIGCC